MGCCRGPAEIKGIQRDIKSSGSSRPPEDSGGTDPASLSCQRDCNRPGAAAIDGLPASGNPEEPGNYLAA